MLRTKSTSRRGATARGKSSFATLVREANEAQAESDACKHHEYRKVMLHMRYIVEACIHCGDVRL